MALSLTGPLSQLDLYRIVHDFDRACFNTAKPRRNSLSDHIIVINQFERMLGSLLPFDLVDAIMRRCLEDRPSVGALMMSYKNTPAFVVLHPLPLSTNTNYINTASKSLLVRLKQTPANEELAPYQQLMTWVFTHHFKKLTVDQKLDLIGRNQIRPCEETSPSQKLELLGRIQASTVWGQAKFKLQFLSWKVQLAAARTLENQVILWTVFGTALALIFTGISLWIAGCFSSVADAAIFQTLTHGYKKALMYFILSACAASGASLAMAGLGLALQIPIFPQSVQEKGAWTQSVGWNCLLIGLNFIIIVTPANRVQLHNLSDDLVNASKELQRLLLQSINEAYVTAIADERLPDLMDKWLQLT